MMLSAFVISFLLFSFSCQACPFIGDQETKNLRSKIFFSELIYL